MFNEKEKKYGETLSLMLNDALEAKNKASDNLAVAQEQERIAKSEIKRLKDLREKSHGGFLSVIGGLLKTLYKKPEDPIEFERLLYPVNAYLSTLRAIPQAEENLVCAQKANVEARAAFNEAVHTVEYIEKLRAKYPHENKDE